MEKVALADQFAKFLEHPPKKTQMRLTRQLIVQYYQTAAKNWGSVVERFDRMDLSSESCSIPSPSKAEDDLAAWLDVLHFDDDEHEHAQRCAHPKISINSVSLYRCSHCGNPSAVLRKCGGCGKTRHVLLLGADAHSYNHVLGTATKAAKNHIGANINVSASRRHREDSVCIFNAIIALLTAS